MRPIILSGRALTNGIELESDNFIVRARRKNDSIEFDIDELEDDEEDSVTSKIGDLIDKIPIIRGISNHISLSMFNKLFIIIIIALDIFKVFEQSKNLSSNNVVSIYTVFTIIFSAIILYFLINIKNIFQYHGAEHKVVNTYEKYRKINLENVKNASRIHYRCGTIYVIFLLFVFIVLSFFIEYISIKFLLSYGIAYEIYISNKFQYVYKLGGWLQKYLTTLEPDEKQIQVAISCVNKILELEKNK